MRVWINHYSFEVKLKLLSSAMFHHQTLHQVIVFILLLFRLFSRRAPPKLPIPLLPIDDVFENCLAKKSLICADLLGCWLLLGIVRQSCS